MATLPRWSGRVIGGVALGVGGGWTAYRAMGHPIRLDSGERPRQPALSFPSSMLVSQQMTVTATEQINHDTKRITFALPTGTNATGVPPGRAVLTQHTPSGAWLPVFRPYTPIPHSEASTLQLLVKKYPNGAASSHLHSLKEGQTLSFRGPIPGYNWQPSASPSTILMVAGGAGITPIYSLLSGILYNPEDQTNIQLLWGVNGSRDIVLKKELERLEERFPERLQVSYVVSGPEASPGAPNLGDARRYRKGYIDKSVLEESIQSAQQSGQFGDSKGVKIFLCGPPKMQDVIAGKKGILAHLGFDKKSIHLF